MTQVGQDEDDDGTAGVLAPTVYGTFMARPAQLKITNEELSQVELSAAYSNRRDYELLPEKSVKHFKIRRNWTKTRLNAVELEV